jgi:thermostable hemolysin
MMLDFAATFPISPLKYSALRAASASPTRSLLECHTRTSPQRRRIEEFVRKEFLTHFNARVTQFMPMLLALRSGGDIRAVVGCRPAAHEPLFLEKYTDEPIECVLARKLAVSMRRDELVEIGGLACRSGRAAIDIVKALAPLLLNAGFSWVVFTGADTVMNVFRYLQLEPHVLCPADPLLLGDERHDWGTYYDHNPQVMAGRLRDGVAKLGALQELQ